MGRGHGQDGAPKMKAREFIPWVLAAGAVAYLLYADSQLSAPAATPPDQSGGPSTEVGGGGGDAF